MVAGAMLLMVVISSGALVDEAKDKAVEQEWTKLNGRWKQVSTEIEGIVTPLPDNVSAVLTINASKWTTETPRGKVELKAEIDPTQNPKTLDRTIQRKDDTRETVPDKCIYKLEANTLTIYTHRGRGNVEANKGRPKEFKSTGG